MEKFEYKNTLNLNEKVMITIVRLSEVYKKKCASVFKNYGLTFAQYNVLRILDNSQNGQSTISRISKLMLVSGANMTGIVKRLAKDGFLIKKSVTEDERIKVLEITPKGKQTLNNIGNEKDELLKKYLVDFSDDYKAELKSALKKMLFIK